MRNGKAGRREIVDSTPTEVGGYKEVVVMITGDNVYSKLKYENGAHRVQRVPVTESAGRVHTSTATVGVMPEYDKVDLKIDPKDIRTDVYRSSGAVLFREQTKLRLTLAIRN